MKPIAHLLHGFVGAGKTTFAKKLEKKHKAVRFTIDEWINNLYGSNPDNITFIDKFERVERLIWKYACRSLELGCDVILDFGFWTRKSRDFARDQIDKLDLQYTFYHVTCPEHVARKRVIFRSGKVPSDSLWINDKAFDKFKRKFEPLENDEDCISIDGGIEQIAAGDADKSAHLS